MEGAPDWIGKLAAALLAIALTAGIATLAARRGDPRPTVLTSSDLDVANPCPEGGMAEYSEPRGPFPIDAAVRDSRAVAEVVVESIGPARLKTDSGGPPAATDLADVSDGLMVFSAAVLRVTKSYKADADVAGYVVVRWGGATEDCPEAAYERSPEMLGMDLDPGASGMLFAESLPEHWNNPMTAHLKAVAAELSAGGETFVPMNPVQWFAYEGQEAISSWSGETMPVYQLRASVEATEHGQDVRLPSLVFDGQLALPEAQMIRESAGVFHGRVVGFGPSAYNTPNGEYAPEEEVWEDGDVVHDFQPSRVYTVTLAVASWWYNPWGYGDAVDLFAFGWSPSDPAGLPVYPDEVFYESADDLNWALGDEVVVVLSRHRYPWQAQAILYTSARAVYFVGDDGTLRSGRDVPSEARSETLDALRAVVVDAFDGAPFGADD